MNISPLVSETTINRAIRESGALFSCADNNAELEGARRAVVSQRRTQALRLVEALKSPTRHQATEIKRLMAGWADGDRRQPMPVVLDKPAVGFGRDVQTPGAWTIIERRPWAGEYRIRTATETGSQQPPEPPAGDRVTEMLTERGARKIAESCFYLASTRGGYNTFLTLTLDAEARERLAQRTMTPAGDLDPAGFAIQQPERPAARGTRCALGLDMTGGHQVASQDQAAETAGPFVAIHPDTGRPFSPVRPGWAWSVQREASRFFEACQKMFTRGWQYTDDQGNTHKIPGSPARFCIHGSETDPKTGAPFTRLTWHRVPLDYLWVAENPDKVDHETGEITGENPHLHVMIRWRVAHRHFSAWADRIESLWGQGMAHLEKINDPAKAGAYVAKAAGYLCKGQGKADQGQIRGNRYGISTRARAPGWMECEKHRLGCMGWLMAEAAELWQQKHGEKIQRRETLKRRLENTTDSQQRHKIGALLERTRKEIEPLPRVSKYVTVLKGRAQLEQFMAWARNRGWTARPQQTLWLVKWRALQWMRRHGERLRASADDVTDWLAMADAGAVALNENDLEALAA